jgi:nitrogen regulatory protein P-II 1
MMAQKVRGAVALRLEDERLAGNARMEDDDPQSVCETPSEKRAVVRSGRVVQIIALVKPFRAQAVLAALESVEVLGGAVREAMGYGRQKNRLHQYLGSEYNTSFVPKVELTIFVEQEHAQAAIKAIVGQARTGRIGDGKILVIPCLERFLSW